MIYVSVGICILLALALCITMVGSIIYIVFAPLFGSDYYNAYVVCRETFYNVFFVVTVGGFLPSIHLKNYLKEGE